MPRAAGLTRCFVALQLDPEPGPGLAPWLDELRAYRELSVPPPENLHLTLAFLGNLDAAGVQLAVEAVAAAAGRMGHGWMVEWGGAGAFPSLGRPKVLWLGLADGTETSAAAIILWEELGARGLPVEDRRFRPHMTVARVRSGLRREVEESLGGLLKRPQALAASEVRGLVLYESRSARGAPVYAALSVARLVSPAI